MFARARNFPERAIYIHTAPTTVRPACPHLLLGNLFQLRHLLPGENTPLDASYYIMSMFIRQDGRNNTMSKWADAAVPYGLAVIIYRSSGLQVSS